MTALEACRIAMGYARHNRDGRWNARFREALAWCGYGLLVWGERQPRPPNTLDAPLPSPGAHGWPIPSIIIQRLSLYDEVPAQTTAKE